MPKDIEIEIQVRVENIKALLKFLRSKAKLVGVTRQVDQYFTPFHRNFVSKRPVKEWLRVRDAKGKSSVTYKNWHYDKLGKSDYCDEYETVVENVDTLRKIFSSLDIKPVATVDKKRQIWLYSDYEIAIDEVKGLGSYIELEYKGSKAKVSPKKTADEMVKFLKDHDCGKIFRNYQGYPFRALFPKEVKEEVQ